MKWHCTEVKFILTDLAGLGLILDIHINVLDVKLSMLLTLIGTPAGLKVESRGLNVDQTHNETPSGKLVIQ